MSEKEQTKKILEQAAFEEKKKVPGSAVLGQKTSF
jgi:hypothetical protein